MQINLNMDNCWGIIRALADLTLKLDEGALESSSTHSLQAASPAC